MTRSPADTGRGPAGDRVAEIVTFRLSAGADVDAFLTAADGMTPFLQSTGAALSRTLSVDETGLWTDHITWTSMRAAKDAAAEMMQQPEAAPFMQQIDGDTVVMRHAPVRHTLTME
ncbi:hypothetical protein G3256_06785 [Roseobacter ponti]|uniref:ABM domain-containing protein n=1 Tax=Roseobacter ponti TaxID=1891787 RepID=A0A858SZ48_9RHOB|nr:hypothetical protein G3256_06785 [Roseobacter ponti]